MKVSTADFIKNYDALADKAPAEPVTVTKNGQDHLVVLCAGEYARLKRRDRWVVGLEDFTAEDLTEIAAHEPPAEDAAFDAELRDWKP